MASSVPNGGGVVEEFAAIVVGSGQGGTPLAAAFAKAGHKTLLIEATHIGGSKSASFFRVSVVHCVAWHISTS